MTEITVSELTQNNFTVDAPKAYFHSAPNSTAQLTTFVVKGDSLTCHYRVNDYTYCSFEKASEDGPYTENIRYYGFFRNNVVIERVIFR